MFKLGPVFNGKYEAATATIFVEIQKFINSETL